MEYDSNGNITRLWRYGLTDNLHGGFGLVDDLYMTYEGNMLTSVRDNATRLPYAGATDFDGMPGENPLTYNGAGSLVSDAGRGIARIDYDMNNNPVRIQFTNGSVTKYIYSAAGEKLRVTHLTAVPNITVAIGSTRELLPSEILSADSVDYLLGGSLTLRNGRIDKLQFDEGYCQATAYSGNASQDNFTFLYYDRDHLGSIRQVIKATGSNKGVLLQSMDYYPFGAQFCDGSTASDVQSRKYNGKELDKMHGLNTYDYGARQYNPVLGRWDRVDPLSEKYCDVSPYTYCGNNPVNAVDPDGRKIVMAQNNSQEYNNQYNNAITYLKEHGCSSLISYLEESPIEITIQEIGPNEQNYTAIDLGVNIIGWKARQGLLTDLGHKLSPAIRLYHELAHQEHKLRNPDQFVEDTALNNSLYQTKDDESIIKNEETYAARSCGEIPQNAMTRESHGGINFDTTSSTSRDIININEDIRFWQYIWGESETY